MKINIRYVYCILICVYSYFYAVVVIISVAVVASVPVVIVASVPVAAVASVSLAAVASIPVVVGAAKNERINKI